jgi:hypothetical protein
VHMLDCFYSAKHGKPIGIHRKHLIEVAHYLAEAYVLAIRGIVLYEDGLRGIRPRLLV